VLLQAGVYEQAEKHFRTVLSVQPDSVDAKLGLAAALRGEGSRKDASPYRAAEALLKEILAGNPGNWAAVHNLAVLYAESMDRPGDASSEYARFLSLAPPDHPERAKAQKWLDEHAASATTAATPSARK
jgi:cytochrome c-type biogenesis protein CcmH/NrfG